MVDTSNVAGAARITRPQSALSHTGRPTHNLRTRQTPSVTTPRTAVTGSQTQRPNSAQAPLNPAINLYSSPPPAGTQPPLKSVGSTTVPPLVFGERLNQVSTGSLLLPLERCYDTTIAKKRERDNSTGGGPQALLGPVGRLVSSKRMYTKSVQETNHTQDPHNALATGQSLGLHDVGSEPTQQLLSQYQLSPERYKRQSIHGASESSPLRTVDIYSRVNRDSIASALLGASAGHADGSEILEDTLRVTPLSSGVLRRPASTTQLTSRSRRERLASAAEPSHGDRLTFTAAKSGPSGDNPPELILQRRIEEFKHTGKKSEFTIDPAQLQGCKLYEQNSKMALDAVRPSTALSSYTRGLNKKYKFTGKIRSASEMGYSSGTSGNVDHSASRGHDTPEGPDERMSHEGKKITRSMSDWVIKSRAGSASSASLRKTNKSTRQELSSAASMPNAPDDGALQQTVVQETEEHVTSTADPLTKAIIEIDSVLPVFKCIKERAEIERIICQDAIIEQTATNSVTGNSMHGSPGALRKSGLSTRFMDSPFKLAKGYTHNQKFDICRELRNYFKSADGDRSSFSYTTSYELMMYAETYYTGLKTQYEAFLNASPELVATGLMQSEFIYLTYDIPPVRQMILNHAETGYTAADAFARGQVSSETPSGQRAARSNPSTEGANLSIDNYDVSQVYARPHPWQNPYELLVCAYHQINPDKYFTLSCNGICYQEPATKTTQLLSIAEWEQERKYYLQLRKNSFFATFRQRKYLSLWRHSIATAARDKSISALTRSSLLASTVFLGPLQEIHGLCYQFSLELRFVPFKKYCFEFLPTYLTRLGLDKRKAEALYVTMTNVPSTITLKQFVVESRNRITAVKSLLGNYITTISEILLVLGKQVQQQVQGRILQQGAPDSGTPSEVHARGHQQSGPASAKTSSDASRDPKKTQKRNSKAILSTLSSYSVFNMSRVRAMIRLVDYMIVNFMLELLLQANDDLMDLFFGVPCTPREKEVTVPQSIRELTQEDLNLLQEDSGRKLIINPPKVQKYLTQGADKQKNASHEVLHHLDSEVKATAKKDDYLILMQFVTSHASDLSRIASESVDDFPSIDSIRLARYVKLQEASIDGRGDHNMAALLVGKIKSSILASRKGEDSLSVYDDLGATTLAKKKSADNPILQKKQQEKEQNLTSIDLRQERNEDISHLLTQVAALVPDTEHVISVRKFTGVPLCILDGRLPPAPIFNIQLILTMEGLCMYPSRTDFINFIGDVLSDYATCVHRSIRPLSFVKLSSFFSESGNNAALAGISIKDILGEYGEYTNGIKALKQHLEYGCDKIREYAVGFLELLVGVSDCISRLSDEGLIQELMQQKVPIVSRTADFTMHPIKLIPEAQPDGSDSSDRSLGLFTEGNPDAVSTEQRVAKEYARDYAFLCQLASEFDFRMMTNYAFPSNGLTQPVGEVPEMDDTARYQAGLQHLNNRTVPLLPETDNSIRSAFLRLITELNPYLFRSRIDSIERVVLSLTKLRVKRVILCFQVDSTPIASALLPIMIKLLQFVRLSIPKTILIVAKNCIHKIGFYTTELKKIPDKSFTAMTFNDAALADIDFLRNEEITTQVIDKDKLLHTKDVLQYFEEAKIEHRLFHELYRKCEVMNELAVYKNIINDAGVVDGVQDYFERFFKFKDDPNCNEAMKDFDRALQMFDLLLARFADRRTRLYSVFRYDLIVLFFKLQKLCYDSLKTALDIDQMIIGTQPSETNDAQVLDNPFNDSPDCADISSIGAIRTPTELFYYLLNQTNLEGPDVFEAPVSTGTAVCKQRYEFFINALKISRTIDDENLYFYQCVHLFESTEFFMPEETVVSYYYRDVYLGENDTLSDGEDAEDKFSATGVQEPQDCSSSPDGSLDKPAVSIQQSVEEADFTTEALDLISQSVKEIEEPPVEPTPQHIHNVTRKLSPTTIVESEFVIKAIRRIGTIRRDFWLFMHGLNLIIKNDFSRPLCIVDYSSVERKLGALRRVFTGLRTRFQILYDEAKFTSVCMNLGELDLKARITAHRVAQKAYYDELAFERQKDMASYTSPEEDVAVLETLFKPLLESGVLTSGVIKACVSEDPHRTGHDDPPVSVSGEINRTVLKYLVLIYKEVVADRILIDEMLHSQGKMLRNGQIVKTGEFLHSLRQSQRSMGKNIDDQCELQHENILGYHNDQLPDDSDFDSALDEDVSIGAELITSTGTGVSITDATNTEARGKVVIPASMVQNLDNYDPDVVLVQYKKQDRIEPLLYNFSAFEGVDDFRRNPPEPTMIEAINYYLQPPPLLTLAIDLVERIETLLPQFKFISSIAFQPRHFKILTREYLRSPNLLLEYKLMSSRLLTLEIDYKEIPLFEILSSEQNNVYRVLFGPESDNITELIMLSSNIIGGSSGAAGSRAQQSLDYNKIIRNLYASMEEEDNDEDLSDKEEEAEQQNIKAKMSGNFSLSVSTVSTHVQAVQTKYLAHLAARKAWITKSEAYIVNEQFADVRGEKDVADSKVLISQMTNYSFILQKPSIYSTDMLYNVCYKIFSSDVEKEEYFRRRARRHAEIKYGGLFIEMDRFTASVNRFVYRGVLETGTMNSFILFMRSIELEYSLLSGLSKLKQELDGLTLPLVPYVGSLSTDHASLNQQVYLITLTDTVENILNDVKTELNTLESQFMRLGDNPAMRELINLKDTCTMCQDAIFIWDLYQRKFITVLQIFAPSSPIVRQLPEDMRTFTKLVKHYLSLMNSVTRNQKVVAWCTKDTIHSIMGWQTDLDAIYANILKYLDIKRRQFMRFFFLSDNELLLVLSAQDETAQGAPFDPSLLTRTLQNCFENVTSLICETRTEHDVRSLYLKGVRSREGEALMLMQSASEKDIRIRGSPDIWLSALDTRISNTLQLMMGFAVQQHASELRSMVSIIYDRLPFQDRTSSSKNVTTHGHSSLTTTFGDSKLSTQQRDVNLHLNFSSEVFLSFFTSYPAQIVSVVRQCVTWFLINYPQEFENASSFYKCSSNNSATTSAMSASLLIDKTRPNPDDTSREVLNQSSRFSSDKDGVPSKLQIVDMLLELQEHVLNFLIGITRNNIVAISDSADNPAVGGLNSGAQQKTPKHLQTSPRRTQSLRSQLANNSIDDLTRLSAAQASPRAPLASLGQNTKLNPAGVFPLLATELYIRDLLERKRNQLHQDVDGESNMICYTFNASEGKMYMTLEENERTVASAKLERLNAYQKRPYYYLFDNAYAAYCYEYHGQAPRLIISPTIDSYRQIFLDTMQHLLKGNSLIGNAGTGKTEISKDFARSLGRFCIVLNCTEALDYSTVVRIFMGMAATGSILCLDEFNRLTLETLSVISKLIVCIQQAIRRKEIHVNLTDGTDTIASYETEKDKAQASSDEPMSSTAIRLRSSASVFITMNQSSYIFTNRIELPGNTMALFRPLMIIKPDVDYIAAGLFLMHGFATAQDLGRKFRFFFTNLDAILISTNTKTRPKHRPASIDILNTQEQVVMGASKQAHDTFTSSHRPSENVQLYDTKVIDLSLRTIKSVILASSHTFKRWLYIFRENTYIKSLLIGDKTNSKQYKEHMTFMGYIETICVIDNLIRLLTPCLVELDKHNFIEIVADVFGRDIVMCYMESDRYDYQATCTTRVDDLSDAVMNSSFLLINNMDAVAKSSFMFTELNKKTLSQASDANSIQQTGKTPIPDGSDTDSFMIIHKYQLSFFHMLLTDQELWPSVFETALNYKRPSAEQGLDIDCQKLGDAELAANSLECSQGVSSMKTGSSIPAHTDQFQGNAIHYRAATSIMASKLNIGRKQITALAQAQALVAESIQKRAEAVLATYRSSCLTTGRIAFRYQGEKYFELENLLWIRTGIILLGSRNTFKTVLWRLMLDETNECTVINPRALTTEGLLGGYQNETFQDGVFSSVLRNYCIASYNLIMEKKRAKEEKELKQQLKEAKRRGKALMRHKDVSASEDITDDEQSQIEADAKGLSRSTERLKFVVLDGPIDSAYAECMNSLLDDNKMLCLANGERIRISNHIRIIFETTDISHTSPSTLSRCGILSLEDSIQNYELLYQVILISSLRELFKLDYLDFVRTYSYNPEKIRSYHRMKMELQSVELLFDKKDVVLGLSTTGLAPHSNVTTLSSYDIPMTSAMGYSAFSGVGASSKTGKRMTRKERLEAYKARDPNRNPLGDVGNTDYYSRNPLHFENNIYVNVLDVYSTLFNCLFSLVAIREQNPADYSFQSVHKFAPRTPSNSGAAPSFVDESGTVLDLTFLCSNMSTIVQQAIRILRSHLCASSSHIYDLVATDPTRGMLVRLLQGYAIFSVVWSCIGLFGKELYVQKIDKQFQEVIFERKYWDAAFHVNGIPLKAELDTTLDQCFFDPYRLIPVSFAACSKLDHLRDYNRVYGALAISRDCDLEHGIFNVEFDTVTSRIFVETSDIRRTLYICLTDLLYYDKTITLSKLLSTAHAQREEQTAKTQKAGESIGGLTMLSVREPLGKKSFSKHGASSSLTMNTINPASIATLTAITGAGGSRDPGLAASTNIFPGAIQPVANISTRDQLQALPASNIYLQISGFGAEAIVTMLTALLQQTAVALPIPLRFSGANKTLQHFVEYFENCFKREDKTLSPSNTIGGTNLFILRKMNMACPITNNLGAFTCFPINEFISFLMQNNGAYIGSSPPSLHLVRNYQIINVGSPLISSKGIAHSLTVSCSAFTNISAVISAVFTAWSNAPHIRSCINPVAFSILPLFTNVLCLLLDHSKCDSSIDLQFTHNKLFAFLRRFSFTTPATFRNILPTADALIDPIHTSVVRRGLLQILLSCLRTELYQGRSNQTVKVLDTFLVEQLIKHLSGSVTELKPSAVIRVPVKLRPDVILDQDTMYLSDIAEFRQDGTQPSKMQLLMRQSSSAIGDQKVPLIEILLQTGNLASYDLNNYQYRQILSVSTDSGPEPSQNTEALQLDELAGKENAANNKPFYRGSMSHPILQTLSSEPVQTQPSFLVTSTFPHSFDGMTLPSVPLPDPCPHVANNEIFSPLVGGMQQELKRRMLKLAYYLAKPDSHLLVVHLAGIFIEQAVMVAVEALQMRARMILDVQELYQFIYGNCCRVNDEPTCLIVSPMAVQPSLPFIEQLLGDPHFLAVNNYHLVILAEPSLYQNMKITYPEIIERCTVEVPGTWPMVEICISAIKLLPMDIAKVFCMSPAGLIPVHKLNESNVDQTMLHRFAQVFSSIADLYRIKLGSEHLIKTPIVFARFLRTYYKMFSDRKVKLVEQEARLEKGLELFAQSSAQASELEVQLEKLQPQLEQQKQKVASILAELAEKKLLAQEQHTVVSSEKMALTIEDKSITAEMTQAKKELNRVLPMLQKADEALQNLNRQDIAELSTFTNPHPLVVLVMNALCALMDQPTNWASARQLLSSGNLISSLLAYDKKTINPKILAKFRTITATPDFTPTKIASISTAATTICSWCLAVVEYATAWDNVKPKIARLEKARQEYTINKQNMEIKEAELEKLQALLKQLTAEADKNKAIEQELESQIRTAEERYKLVKSIKTLLEVEHETWEESLSEIRVEHSSLATTVTESVKFMFITLLGAASSSKVEGRAESKACLSPSENTHSSKCLDEYVDMNLVKLHNDEELCMWRQYCLPSDNATTESMGCLMNSVDIPYIFDPESVAETFLSNLPNVTCAKYSSEGQSSVLKKLIDAGIRGKVCLITNMGSEIPSFIMEVVKQVSWDAKLLFCDASAEHEEGELTTQQTQSKRDLEIARKNLFLHMNDVPLSQEDEDIEEESPLPSAPVTAKTPSYTLGMLKKVVSSTPERRKVKIARTPRTTTETAATTPRTQSSVANTPRFNPYNEESAAIPPHDILDPGVQAVMEHSLVVKIHGYDYLFSKTFNLILLSNDFSIISQLSPEIIANFQIVSFAKSRAAIEDHLISVMIKSINPKIERSYLNAVVEASIAKSSLKLLELQVLDTLMNSSLEQALSEELLGSLHGASMQKASIKRRLAFITRMHRKILQMRDTHRNAAVTCTSIFLGVRQLLKISLQTYSHAVARIIICNNDMSQDFASNAAYGHLLNLSTVIQVNSPYMSNQNTPNLQMGSLMSSFAGIQSPLNLSTNMSVSRSKIALTETYGATGDKRMGTSTLAITRLADSVEDDAAEGSEREAQEEDNCSFEDLVTSRVNFEKAQELMEEKEMADLTVELEQLNQSRISHNNNEYIETIIALFILAFDESSAMAFLYHIFTYLDTEQVSEPLLWIMTKCLIISGHDYARIVGHSSIFGQRKNGTEGTTINIDNCLDISIIQESFFNVEKLYVRNSSQLESMPLPADMRKAFSGPGEHSTKLSTTEILQRRNHAANLISGLFCIKTNNDQSTDNVENLLFDLNSEAAKNSVGLKYCLNRSEEAIQSEGADHSDIFANTSYMPYNLELQQNIISSVVHHWSIWQRCMSVTSSDKVIASFTELMKTFMLSDIFTDSDTVARFEDHLLLLFIKHFRPAFLRIAVNNYIIRSIKRYNIRLSAVQRLNFGSLLNISDSQLPILFNHSSSVDAVRFISQFLPQESYQLMQASTTAREAIVKAKKNVMLKSNTADYADDNPIVELKVLPLSKGMEKVALNALSQHISSPVWLVLQNAHLVPDFVNNELRRHYAALTANSYRMDVGDGSIFEASAMEQSVISINTSTIDANQDPIGATAPLRGGPMPPGVTATPLLRTMAATLLQAGGIDFKPVSRHFKLIITAEGDASNLSSFAQVCISFKRSSDVSFSSVYKRTMELSQKYLDEFKNVHNFDIEQYKEEHMQTTIGLTDINTLFIKNSYAVAAIISRCSFGTHGWTSVYSSFDESDLESALITLFRILAHELVFNDNCLVLYNKLIENIIDKYGAKMGTQHDRTVLKYLTEFVFGYSSRHVRAQIGTMLLQDPSQLYNRGDFDTTAMKKMISNAILSIDVDTVRDNPRHLGLADPERVYLYQREGQQILEFLDTTLGSGVMYSVAKSVSYNVRLMHYDRRKLALSLPTEINVKIDANEKSCPLMFFMYQEIMFYNRMVKDLMDYIRYARYDSLPDYILQFMIQRHVDNLFKLVNHLIKTRSYYNDAMIDRNYMNIDISLTFRPSALFTAFRAQACYITGGTMDQYMLAYDIVPYANLRQRDNVQISGLKLKSAYVDLSIGKVSSQSVTSIYNPLPAMRVLAQRTYKKKSVIISLGNFSSTIYTSEQAKRNMNDSFVRTEQSMTFSGTDDSAPVTGIPGDNSSLGGAPNERSSKARPMSGRPCIMTPGKRSTQGSKTATPAIPTPLPEVQETHNELSSMANTPKIQQSAQPKSRLSRLGIKLTLDLGTRSSSRKSMTASSNEGSRDTTPRDDLRKQPGVMSVSSVTESSSETDFVEAKPLNVVELNVLKKYDGLRAKNIFERRLVYFSNKNYSGYYEASPQVIECPIFVDIYSKEMGSISSVFLPCSEEIEKITAGDIFIVIHED
ncbi:Dynein heavy chain [Giardia duodenalis]|uniref:Dynein heavy chain n=1 Tax=Giardia intestinalis TaxID=5741 RepID=V6TWK2_GIAIN|nr:Dynein heavy chain [Giardia intestinalis]